jgi:hypothetical protein
MNRIRTIRRLAGILASLAAALLASNAISPAAFATRDPPPGDTGGPTVLPVHTVVTGGMPGWQIILIAAAAAVLAAALAVILDRARAARRQLTAPSA